ncbi:hypothetical protein Vretimale_12867 [Volvox reticuliferus]|uniref:Uncharacterized protein n=1 Tax=Volvox reticuliferus TaxID=1737510 RepID=A0A8J4GKC7_9CHLO|nr:hypothetical protein Vretifemale_9215 [Volvox reticuliferus]GIM08961.1 hypothetical protein Vretimale_12867 [Volvox reticuliferus]
MTSQATSRWKYIPGSNTGCAAAAVEPHSPPAASIINGRLDMVAYAKPNMNYAPEESMTKEEIDEVLHTAFQGLQFQVTPCTAACTELVAKQVHPRMPVYVVKAVLARPRKQKLRRAAPWK